MVGHTGITRKSEGRQLLRVLRRFGASLCAFLGLQAACFSAVLEVGEHKAYATIAAAVDASSRGDTIMVYPGTYVESVGLKDGCVLAGVGPPAPVLVPPWWSPVGSPLFLGDGSVARGIWLCGGTYGGVVGYLWHPSDFHVEDCVFWGNGTAVRCEGPGNRTFLTNCTIWGNAEGILCESGGSAVLLNTIVYGNTANLVGQLAHISATHSCIQGGYPGEGNVDADALFLDPRVLLPGDIYDQIRGSGLKKPDLRLRADSPCIDAGLNSPDLPQFDIAGMHRIMFGGNSLTVDMGAYEFYINTLTPGPEPLDTTLTWSSLADKSYSIFYTDDLFNWHTAIANFPSSGSQTTSWTDDGSLTGLPPLLAPKRFYRLLENP